MSAQTPAQLPPAVGLAQNLTYGLVALMALRTVLTIVFEDSIIDHYLDGRSSTLPREMLENSAPSYVAISIVSLVVFGGLLAVTAYFFSSGAGWSRIVATVFAALSVLGGLVSFIQDAPVWFVLVNVLVAAVAAVVIWFLYRPESNAWFGKRA